MFFVAQILPDHGTLRERFKLDPELAVTPFRKGWITIDALYERYLQSKKKRDPLKTTDRYKNYELFVILPFFYNPQRKQA